MDIVACTDNNYIMPTGVMMYSVCCNNADVDIIFHIITGGVGAEGKEKLIKNIKTFKNKSVIFYDAKELDTSSFPMMSNCLFPISAFYRLFIAKILPIALKKVIYLDVDTIVCQSLLPLCDINLGGYPIAAAPDCNIECSDFSERLNYPKDNGYFNSGVLLINLEYWRTHNVLNDCIEYTKLHADSIIYADQDILNYVFRESKMILPIKYNLQSGFLWNERNFSAKYCQEVEQTINNPVILHFTGAHKPWHTSCRHPYLSTYMKYKSQTVWKDEPLQEDRPLPLRIKKAIGKVLRKYHLIEELPPYGKGFLPNLKPLD